MDSRDLLFPLTGEKQETRYPILHSTRQQHKFRRITTWAVFRLKAAAKPQVCAIRISWRVDPKPVRVAR